MQYYLAIDLGAESGRIILGNFHPEGIQLQEIHRFPTGMTELNGKYHWNIVQIYSEIIKGLEECVREKNIQPVSIGIDTWGVDYGLLASDQSLMGLPFTYRDHRTDNAVEDFSKILSLESLYQKTGILIANYNTVFQLFATKKMHPELINSASDLLFIPDLLSFFLTGNKKTEKSFAATSQLFSPFKNDWDEELLEILDVKKQIFQEVISAGAKVGFLSESICATTKMSAIPVVAVLTHDTNSAVAAIPAQGDDWAFLSTGTWSLMGFESKEAFISDVSFSKNFSNEIGFADTFHVLKNLMGLWILQQCKSSWKEENYSYSQLVELAQRAPEFKSFIDIDDASFLNPVDMPQAILDFLEKTNQSKPENHGEFVRIILESLALKYRLTMDEMESVRGKKIETLYITGGGIQNKFLCQLTANAIAKTCIACSAEGSATGNIIVQAIANQEFENLAEVRTLLAKNGIQKTYFPQDSEKWEKEYSRYLSVLNFVNN